MSDPVVRLLIGGYSPPRGGTAGITLVEHYPGRGSLGLVGPAAVTDSPSALAVSPDGQTVFAVQESDPALVHSFRWSGSTLQLLPSEPSGGADPCHLLVHPSGRYLLTANYSGGTIAAHPIGPHGLLEAASDVRAFTGDGPDPVRQTASHPHHLAFGPGDGELVVADLGADLVRRVAFDDQTGRFGPESPSVPMPRGSGPRQIAFSPAGDVAYVLGELDSSLSIVDWRSDHPDVVASAPALAPVPPGNLAATLALTADGRSLYASHRGADVITTFDVDGLSVRPHGSRSSGGRGPRHFTIVGDWLYAANEASGTVAAISLTDSAAPVTVSVPSPTFVLPIPLS